MYPSSKRISSDYSDGRNDPPPYSSLQFDVDVERLPFKPEPKAPSPSKTEAADKSSFLGKVIRWFRGRRPPPMEEEILLPFVAAFAATAASARPAVPVRFAAPAPTTVPVPPAAPTPTAAPVPPAIPSTADLAHEIEMLRLQVAHGRELAAVTARATNAELAAANSNGSLALANQRADAAERRAAEWERMWHEERARADMADIEREARFRRTMAWE
ncbi:hypothetical protein MMC30_006125 [Trapelia coarctata]|nr:hypothetical protein [Trapelia coarctata]